MDGGREGRREGGEQGGRLHGSVNTYILKLMSPALPLPLPFSFLPFLSVDQVEITAFTHVYRRPVRVWSYNYAEARLLSVITPLVEPTPTTPPSNPTATGTASAAAPAEEIWLLHLHGHYSLLQKGEPPQDEAWEQMLREWGKTKEERTQALSAHQQQQQPPQHPQKLQEEDVGEQAQEKEEVMEGRREGRRELPRIFPALSGEADEQQGERREVLPVLMEKDAKNR